MSISYHRTACFISQKVICVIPDCLLQENSAKVPSLLGHVEHPRQRDRVANPLLQHAIRELDTGVEEDHVHALVLESEMGRGQFHVRVHFDRPLEPVALAVAVSRVIQLGRSRNRDGASGK